PSIQIARARRLFQRTIQPPAPTRCPFPTPVSGRRAASFPRIRPEPMPPLPAATKRRRATPPPTFGTPPRLPCHLGCPRPRPAPLPATTPCHTRRPRPDNKTAKSSQPPLPEPPRAPSGQPPPPHHVPLASRPTTASPFLRLTCSWGRSRPTPGRARRCREVHHLQSALRQPPTRRAGQPTPVPSASRRPSGPQRAAAPPSPGSTSPGDARRRPPTRIPPLQLVLNGRYLIFG
uniref:Uncharacterized protein n=1 Tax=Aegilops tauschii subsp. strangulata TaxID=200361 RepID=A0A453E847_AEGTS